MRAAPPSRETVLAQLGTAMDELQSAIQAADPATAEAEELQLRRYREFAYTANQFRKLKRDSDLTQMQEELDGLQAELTLGDRESS